MEQDIKDLLIKYRNGSITEMEMALLETWYLKWIPEDREISLQRLDELEEEVYGSLPKPVRKVRLWPRVAAVAAAVAMIVFGVWFFNHQDDPEMNSGQAVVANDIAPGKNGAILTLANGKVIQLSDAKTGVVIGEDLKYSDGEILRDALDDKAGKDLTASTTKGQTYEFTLPDGTHVWLNADSKISFSSQFIGKERKILLDGEAYFEVAKDKKRPFIVNSGTQHVEVLGTHFNVSAYKEDRIKKTTLLEGAVKVSFAPQGGKVTTKAQLLKPNQQSEIVGDVINVKDVDATEATAWKNGEFVFNDEPLHDIMRRVARWYDVEVVYDGVDKAKLFNGTISRFEHISKVLDILQATGKVKFKIEGRKVIVTK